jgi:SAM-dependent methyltransferase
MLPADLQDASQDVVWSACAMEHLGTLEQGLGFVEAAMRCLKPGGIAVHTTELNLDEAGETLSQGSTVLYQRKHLDVLAARLAAQGHRMLPLDHAHPPAIMDQFVDIPPFEEGRVPLGHLSPPHLRLSISGYAATSVGIVVIAGHAAP